MPLARHNSTEGRSRALKPLLRQHSAIQEARSGVELAMNSPLHLSGPGTTPWPSQLAVLRMSMAESWRKCIRLPYPDIMPRAASPANAADNRGRRVAPHASDPPSGDKGP
jgi:hypothetical protein